MQELSDKKHWDAVHSYEVETRGSEIGPQDSPDRPHSLKHRLTLKDRLKTRTKALLGRKTLERMSGYDAYLLWNVIFKKYVPQEKGAEVLEVGSAPGEFLVEFKQHYDCVPYGVEYSKTGVELNRKVFSSHGINPENVIYADFFSDEFQEEHKERFDIVMSRGFVEHFTDPESVIQKHLNLLKPGGRLIVSIPNVRGVNYVLSQLFHKELIPLHNLGIMKKQEFSRLFDTGRLTSLFCDYYGTFSFSLFYTKRDSPMRFVLSLCFRFQLLLNLLFRLVLRDKGAESWLFSPNLLFIGEKTR